jgi:hypothetical protein
MQLLLLLTADEACDILLTLCCHVARTELATTGTNPISLRQTRMYNVKNFNNSILGRPYWVKACSKSNNFV